MAMTTKVTEKKIGVTVCYDLTLLYPNCPPVFAFVFSTDDATDGLGGREAFRTLRCLAGVLVNPADSQMAPTIGNGCTGDFCISTDSMSAASGVPA